MNDWRDRIRVSVLIKKLQDHVEAPAGEDVLSATPIKAAEILLRKAIPDLKAVEHSGQLAPPVLRIDMRRRDAIEGQFTEVVAREAPARPERLAVAPVAAPLPSPTPEAPKRPRGRPRKYPEGYEAHRRAARRQRVVP
jgi:hypothetical protein